MRSFVVSLLLVSAVAIGANGAPKVHVKRGILGSQGYSAGVGLSGGLVSGGALNGHSHLSALDYNVGSSSKYLPPVISDVKVGLTPPLPLSASYNVHGSSVPHSSYVPASVHPASTYGAPAISYGAPAISYGAPAVSYGVPAHSHSVGVSIPASSYDVHHQHVSLPSTNYGVPSVGHVGNYDVSSISAGSFGVSKYHTGHAAGLSASYGAPSTVVETVPSVGASLSSVSYPSKSYGAPAVVDHEYVGGVSSGHSLGLSAGVSSGALFNSVPSHSYGVPAISSHEIDHSLGSLNLHHGSTSFVPSVSSNHYDNSDGYSYPVPANKLHI